MAACLDWVANRVSPESTHRPPRLPSRHPTTRRPPEEPPSKTPAQEMPGSDIPVGHDRGIAYVTGGVGQDEATALRRLAPGYTMPAPFPTAPRTHLSGPALQILRSAL